MVPLDLERWFGTNEPLLVTLATATRAAENRRLDKVDGVEDESFGEMRLRWSFTLRWHRWVDICVLSVVDVFLVADQRADEACRRPLPRLPVLYGCASVRHRYGRLKSFQLYVANCARESGAWNRHCVLNRSRRAMKRLLTRSGLRTSTEAAPSPSPRPSPRN